MVSNSSSFIIFDLMLVAQVLVKITNKVTVIGRFQICVHINLQFKILVVMTMRVGAVTHDRGCQRLVRTTP
jgi:hypothetical protein